MSETVIHEFWLVATVQDCKLDAQKEVAHAKFFSKWHFQDAEFPKRVREGRRKLVGEGDQDAASLAEKLEKGTMLKGKMLDEAAADAAEEHPSMTFPVNLDLLFQNVTGTSEVLKNLCWVQFKDGVVSVQLVMSVAVHAPMHLHEFPYDRHIIPFYLSTRSWKDKAGKHKWKLAQTVPPWAPNKYAEDKTILSEKMTVPDTEYDHRLPECYFGDEKDANGKALDAKPILCLHVQRRPEQFVVRVTLPVFIVVSLALSVFGIKGRSLEMEYNAAFTSLLTMTAFSFSVQSTLPHVAYMTIGDKYFLFGFLFHLLIVAKTLMVSASCEEDSYSSDLEIGEGIYLLGTTWCQNVDHWGALTLVAAWIGVHSLMIADIWYPKLISRRVRQPWDFLADRFAKYTTVHAERGTTSTPEERKQYKDKNPVAGAWGPFTPRTRKESNAAELH